jgi:hypothetical protein
VSDVMKECCAQFRYRFSQFRAVYEAMKAGRTPTPVPGAEYVQNASLDIYQQAFLERCDN